MKLLSIVLVILLGFSAKAQSVIEGSITSSDDQTLPFATIVLTDETEKNYHSILSDETGNFSFQVEQSGNYLLIGSMTGYDTDTMLLEVSNSIEPLKIYLKLQRSANVLESVEVYDKVPLYEQKIDRTVVNVGNSITAKGSTVLTVLERSPGVRVDRMNQQIQLQGNQGVLVMLDGKQLRMEESGLIQLLQGMPAENIEQIELITSPPASFDAQGNAGVINIITKKQTTPGLLHNFSVNTGYGKRAKYGGSYALNFQKGKSHVFADLSANYDVLLHNFKLDRANQYEGITTLTSINSHRPARQGSYNYRAGIDYDLSERTTIGGLFSGYVTNWDLDATTTSGITNNMGDEFSSDLSSVEQNDWIHWMYNVNLRHRLKDSSEITIDFDYLDYLGDNPSAYIEQIINSQGSLLSQRSFISTKETPIDFQVLKVDYKKQLSDHWSLETGVKGTLTYFENDLELADLVGGIEVFDDRFTDNFQLDENLGAVYSSFDYKKDKFALKAGGRYEYYKSDLTSTKQGDILLQEYGRFFPSAFLSYDLDKNQALQMAYSERITRPAINQIAPAFFYWGYNSLLGGNPDIQPALSRRLSASYRYKESLLQFQWTDEENALTWQPAVFPEENQTLIRSENLEYRQQASLNINTPLKITPWWESSYNATGYLQKMKPMFQNMSLKTNTSTYVDANMTHNFFLPKEFSLELTTTYTSDIQFGLGVFKSRNQWDLGLQKELSPKSQISVTGTDLFGSGSFFQINYDEPALNLKYDQTYDIEGPIFRLNFRHNFGDTNLKKRGNRSTGSDEERNRMN